MRYLSALWRSLQYRTSDFAHSQLLDPVNLLEDVFRQDRQLVATKVPDTTKQADDGEPREMATPNWTGQNLSSLSNGQLTIYLASKL